ncbi:McrC family protein [Pseudobutyrivibrio ruminis]|uniref:McrC family protein n=1 Tax=Pseudobutyrivibrio ruminis TaxID=46206 RepID=UPI00051C7DD1|nr:hypothetical protein [Pseudobutyrivibrio ruminis]
MVNGFEYTKIKSKKLPSTWQKEGVLGELEHFLQENWEQRSIFYSDYQITSRQQFIDFDRKDGIKLQNYVGTIIFKGEQLNIFPKIFKEDEDDYDTDDLELNDLIGNLVYWLEYCDRLNFPFVSMKGQLDNSENLMELFITIYVNYVRTAIDKQRYFQYENTTETGSFVKGKINFIDYATKKYPSGNRGALEYTYSNFVFDNLMNRIIKCTCIFLLNISNQTANKNTIRNILIKLGEVETVNCSPYDCDKIHLSAMNSNYRIILSMSKMFLLNKVNSYNIGNTDAFCFLFPAEILFEGFIGGFIRDTFSDIAKVKTQASDQYLADLLVDGEVIGNAFLLKEDILVEVGEKTFVLDTKYKEIDRFHKVKDNKKLKISDNDMKQMAIYAAKRNAEKLFLIYPLHKNEDLEEVKVSYNIHLQEQGLLETIPLEIIKVPFAYSESKEKTRLLLKQILLNAMEGQKWAEQPAN